MDAAARASTSRAIRWIFSDAPLARRGCRPTATPSAPTAGATRPARAAGAAPRSRRAAWSWRSASASFVVALGAGAAGRQRVRAADRPGLHPAGAAHAGGQQPGAHRRQGARRSRRSCWRCPRCKHVSTWVGGAGPAQPGLAEHRAGGPQGPQALAEAGRRTRSARRSPRCPAPTPASASTGRSTSPSWAATPKAWPRLAERVRREGEEDPRRGRRRDLGASRPAGLRRAPEARRGARTGPDRAADWPAACAPTSTARPPPTGPRPTATRSTSCCA